MERRRVGRKELISVVADFNEVIDEYRDALRRYVEGDPEPVIVFFSPRDDVTLASPWGPPCRGRDDVAKATREAGVKFQLGGPLHFEEVTTRFEEVSRYNTSELGFVVQLERHEGQVTSRNDPVVIDRRVTMVFRLEDDTWKLLHRHADPITRAQRDEVAAFVDHVIPLLRSEVMALQTGDPSPRKSLWSHHDPVSLFGAEASASGWGQIEPIFDRLAASFSDGQSSDYEVVTADVSGDLAYVAAIENSVAATRGSALDTYRLRVTTIFRREQGAWKVVHRHGDPIDAASQRTLARRRKQGAM
jgi:ketosteroid isomerase-like protein